MTSPMSSISSIVDPVFALVPELMDDDIFESVAAAVSIEGVHLVLPQDYARCLLHQKLLYLALFILRD